MIAATKGRDILARFPACSSTPNWGRQNCVLAVATEVQKRLMTGYTCSWFICIFEVTNFDAVHCCQSCVHMQST